MLQCKSYGKVQECRKHCILKTKRIIWLLRQVVVHDPESILKELSNTWSSLSQQVNWLEIGNNIIHVCIKPIEVDVRAVILKEEHTIVACPPRPPGS